MGCHALRLRPDRLVLGTDCYSEPHYHTPFPISELLASPGVAGLMLEFDAAAGIAICRVAASGRAAAGRTHKATAVARRAHQLLGAISFCEEHSLHLFHKRILAAGLDFGDPSHHLETVASSMGLV